MLSKRSSPSGLSGSSGSNDEEAFVSIVLWERSYDLLLKVSYIIGNPLINHFGRVKVRMRIVIFDNRRWIKTVRVRVDTVVVE